MHIIFFRNTTHGCQSILNTESQQAFKFHLRLSFVYWLKVVWVSHKNRKNELATTTGSFRFTAKIFLVISSTLFFWRQIKKILNKIKKRKEERKITSSEHWANNVVFGCCKKCKSRFHSLQYDEMIFIFIQTLFLTNRSLYCKIR